MARNIRLLRNPATIVAEVRYDDDCGNGHNTFSITGTIRAIDKRINRQDNVYLAGGCLHEDVVAKFPELAPLVKWHLCSSDGPMHYLSNTVYMADDRDCWGYRKGEPSSFKWAVQFGDNPIKHKIHTGFAKFLQSYRAGVAGEYDFEVIRCNHENKLGDGYKFAPKYTFGGYAEKWHECPFDTEPEALDFSRRCKPNPLNFFLSLQHGAKEKSGS